MAAVATRRTHSPEVKGVRKRKPSVKDEGKLKLFPDVKDLAKEHFPEGKDVSKPKPSVKDEGKLTLLPDVKDVGEERQIEKEQRRNKPHYIYICLCMTIVVVVIVFSCLSLLPWKTQVDKPLGSTQQQVLGRSDKPQNQHGKQEKKQSGKQGKKQSGKQGTRQSNEAQSLDRSPTSGELLPVHPCARLERDVKGIEKWGSKRGEHVINNDILRVYEKIIRSFIKDVMADDGIDHMIKSGRLSKNSKVMEAIDHSPLPDEIKEQIGENMVAYFDVKFIDKNSDLYGRCIEKLRQDVVDYMKKVWKGLLGGEKGNVEIANLRETVKLMIEREHFVDKKALKQWLKQGGRPEMFEKAWGKVVEMLKKLVDDKNNHMVRTWVKELFGVWKKSYN